MLTRLRRFLDDFADLSADDSVLFLYSNRGSQAVEQARADLARRDIVARRVEPEQLVAPDFIELICSSRAKRVVVFVEGAAAGSETVGPFLSLCERHGKSVALRRPSRFATLFFAGVDLANGRWPDWHGL